MTTTPAISDPSVVIIAIPVGNPTNIVMTPPIVKNQPNPLTTFFPVPGSLSIILLIFWSFDFKMNSKVQKREFRDFETTTEYVRQF